MKSILILTGGRIYPDFAAEYLQGKEFDRIIAADSGLSSCEKLGITPTEILGDFDSLKDRNLLEKFKNEGVPIEEFPTRKDYTDTHLAVEYALQMQPEELLILGATGTRMDHMLANIGLLERISKAQIRGKIVDEYNEIEMLCGQNERIYKKDSQRKFFSLVAWGGEVTGIDLIGFSYPLENATLLPSHSIGISNELDKAQGILRMKQGNLLVIRSND